MDVLYYLEWDGRVEPPVVNDDWFESVRRRKHKMLRRIRGHKVLCWRCVVRPEFRSQPVDIPLDNIPQDQDLTYPSGLALIIRRDFLDFISPHLHGHVVGSCVWAQSGEQIPEYATIHTVASKSIYLRSDSRATYHVCEECGMPYLGSDPRSSPPEYITRSQLSGRRAYQVDGHDSIVVTGELRQKIAEAGFAAEWHPYPVYDKPIDGRKFPGDE